MQILIADHRGQSPRAGRAAFEDVLRRADVVRQEGRYEEAADLAEQMVNGPNYDRDEVWHSLIAANRWDRLEELVVRYARDHAGKRAPAFSAEWRGRVHIGKGRLRAALVDLREAIALFANSGNWVGNGGWLADQIVELMIAAEDHEGAISVGREAVRIAPSVASAHYALGRALLHADRPAEAEASLARIREIAKESVSPIPGYLGNLLECELHLVHGDTPAAARVLATAAALAIENRVPSMEWPLQARVAEASNDLRGALAAWERALQPRSRLDGLIVYDTLALYELGRLNDELGQADAARDNYRRFLARWGEADMSLPAVAMAKARMAALGG